MASNLVIHIGKHGSTTSATLDGKPIEKMRDIEVSLVATVGRPTMARITMNVFDPLIECEDIPCKLTVKRVEDKAE